MHHTYHCQHYVLFVKRGKLNCFRKIVKAKEKRNACLRRKLHLTKLMLRLCQLRMQIIRRKQELNEIIARDEHLPVYW